MSVKEVKAIRKRRYVSEKDYEELEGWRVYRRHLEGRRFVRRRVMRLSVILLAVIVTFGFFVMSPQIKFVVPVIAVDPEGNAISNAEIYVFRGLDKVWQTTTDSEGKAEIYLSPFQSFIVTVKRDSYFGSVSTFRLWPGEIKITAVELS